MGEASTARGGAFISDDGFYRYRLWRHLAPSFDSITGRTVVFVMLNPSTADGFRDDATLRRCVSFAGQWGAERLDVVNLFAYRATDPDDLRRAYEAGRDIVGDENYERLRACVESVDRDRGDRIVCAWGSHPLAADVWSVALDEEDGPFVALRVNEDGSPGHPLYVPRTAKPVPWPPPDPEEPTADA